MTRATRRNALLIASAVATLSLFPSPAVGQSAAPSAPSDVERAVTLASPGVVFIDTSVRIHVRLIYQNANAVSGLGHLDRTYAFDYATGSGFVVTPTGTVVTASHVVEPDRDSMRNYAANRLVLEGFGYDYPNANSSRFDQFTLPVGWQNVLLQQCYKAVACRFTITPIETVFSPVDIAQTQLPKGTPARILTSTGFENTDVAVLQVNGSNMPTVSLGDTAGDLATGDEVVALGFPGTSRDSLQTGVTQPNKVFGRVSNIRPQGTSNIIEVDANIEPGMSGGPVIDSSGDVLGLISFTLLQSSGESGAKYLRTIDDIKAALAAAGVTPARGPPDTAFSDAMDLYWGNHFTAAVPELQKAVDLYPGHPLATEFLAQAQSKAGTAADIPLVEPTPAPAGARMGSLCGWRSRSPVAWSSSSSSCSSPVGVGSRRLRPQWSRPCHRPCRRSGAPPRRRQCPRRRPCPHGRSASTRRRPRPRPRPPTGRRVPRPRRQRRPRCARPPTSARAAGTPSARKPASARAAGTR